MCVHVYMCICVYIVCTCVCMYTVCVLCVYVCVCYYIYIITLCNFESGSCFNEPAHRPEPYSEDTLFIFLHLEHSSFLLMRDT